jgi:hypothetical protein
VLPQRRAHSVEPSIMDASTNDWTARPIAVAAMSQTLRLSNGRGMGRLNKMSMPLRRRWWRPTFRSPEQTRRAKTLG